MSTPHNTAKPGAFAKTVLMPGDPLRAKYIAETFLENAELVTSVRNVLGYTGTYNGKRVSVMASGMGMPSIGIYSYELFAFYGVETIIRVGSAGAFDEKLNAYDVVIADAAFSDSSFAKVHSGDDSEYQYPSRETTDLLMQAAEKMNLTTYVGPIYSSDVFYMVEERFWDKYGNRGLLCCEMESFALFHNAKYLGKKAACILTISDSLVKEVNLTPEERQTSFDNMIKIALEAAEE